MLIDINGLVMKITSTETVLGHHDTSVILSRDPNHEGRETVKCVC